MKKSISMILMALSAAFALRAQAGINVRSSADGLLWQTVLDASEPLSWRWEEGDTAATLVVSCLTAQASAEYAIVRAEGAVSGSQAFVLPEACEQGKEHLFDMTLTIFAGDAARISHVARLAYLPSVTEGAIGVRVPETGPWRKVRGPVALGYSPLWDGSADATSASLGIALDGGRTVTEELSPSGGWTALDAAALYPDTMRGNLGLTLGFDGITAATADLLWAPKAGTILMLR